MPGNVSHAKQKPEVAVADRNGTGCLQGKWTWFYNHNKQASEVNIKTDFLLISFKSNVKQT